MRVGERDQLSPLPRVRLLRRLVRRAALRGGRPACRHRRLFPALLTLPADQGGWETDETATEAAARESLEEAGVRGELQARRRSLPRC